MEGETNQGLNRISDTQLDRIRHNSDSSVRPPSPPPRPPRRRSTSNPPPEPFIGPLTPQSPPPEALPLGSSIKKAGMFKSIMKSLRSPAIETYTASLNQSKTLEKNDLIWVRPARNQYKELGLIGAAHNSAWLLITLVEQVGIELDEGSQWFFTTEGMVGVAKINLIKQQAWEHMPDITSNVADQARRDRILDMGHLHNICPTPKITMVKEGERVPAIEPEDVMRSSPTTRTTAREAAASRWRLDHPDRELSYGVQGCNGPIIIDTSEDPIDGQALPLPDSPAQKYFVIFLVF